MNVYINCYEPGPFGRRIARFECELFQSPLRAFETSRVYPGKVTIEAMGRAWVSLLSGKLILVDDGPDDVRTYALDMIQEMVNEVKLIDEELHPKAFPIKLQNVLKT